VYVNGKNDFVEFKNLARYRF